MGIGQVQIRHDDIARARVQALFAGRIFSEIVFPAMHPSWTACVG